MAHVALADDAALGVVLRHAVRTVPGAVLAPDAGIGAVADDPGHRILLIGVDRTATEAGRLEAVIAAHRKVGAGGVGKEPALDVADPPPVDRRRIPVLLVAGDDAALAADALLHVEVKAVLLAGLECARRHSAFAASQRRRDRSFDGWIGDEQRGRGVHGTSRQRKSETVRRGAREER